ncbi:MAG: rhodanese-like domain-containing protein [Bryocella sp.]
MRSLRLVAFIACAVLFLTPFSASVAHAAIETAATIPTSALIQPAKLAEMLHAEGSPPVILQVGFSVLYTEAHIPGAQYVGPSSKQTGIQNLKTHVASLPHGQLIIIYCGCCPWSHCPNVAPAYDQLRALGFTNVKVLYLADNFGADWVNKGYPVLRGD